MLPYLNLPSIQLWGPLNIHPFRLLVLIGCFAGYAVGRWHAGHVGLDQRAFARLVLWVLVPAFIFSHVVSELLYYPDMVLRQPLRLFDLRGSMSSYGGFLGAALGAMIYLQRTHLPRWNYADALVVGWASGWCFGRLGCAIVHDHPGIRSDFILAVQFPDAPRHDLGLYEWLFTIALNILVLSIRRQPLPPGTILGIVCVCYAPVRFLLDFLRIGDTRYVGLTPGQYFSLVFLLGGIWVLATVWQRRPLSSG